MKNFGKRCAALALTLALMLSLAQTAGASYALGSELSERTTELAAGAALTTQSLWSASKGDLRTEHYVTYTPNGAVTPIVFSGTYVASMNTVSAAAAQLEERGLRVAAAINGGFFNADGTAVGMIMTEGVLRTLDVENYALIGFTNDGRVFIDESRPVMTASWTGMEPIPAAEPTPDPWAVQPTQDPWAAALPTPDPFPTPTPEPVRQPVARSFTVAGFNAYRNARYLGGLYLYNKDFSSRVLSGGDCVYAILRPLGEDGLRMNSAMVFQVVSVTDTAQGAAFDGVIPEGCYMLYAEDHDNQDLLSALRGLPVGGQVSLTVSGAGAQWAEAAYGVSGLYTLLRNGQIVDGLPSSANPYTAVGVKPDGSAVFYTIDGRQSGWSIGASYAQVAQRLQELGCVAAAALDGGGSTTLGATLPGSRSFRLVNRPSSGEQRRINNTIALVSRDGDSIVAPGAYVSAPNRVVLAGSSLPVSADPYDATGRPAEDQPLSWSAEGGAVAVDENGDAVYNAGEQAGVYVVSAAPGGGGMSVRVVDQLTGLTVTRGETASRVTELNLEPGDQVDLTVSGAWWNLPVAMNKDHIVWTVDASIGSIDENGRFTAGPRNGEGVITVSAGGLTVTIPVKIDSGCPFTDIAGHWSEEYVIQMFKLGLTTGYEQPDGTAVYRPGGQLTRAELLAFVTRLLGVDPLYYEEVQLPFADQDAIPEWAMPYVKAMYTLKVLQGSKGQDGQLYADANSNVTREETMTILGRILAPTQPWGLPPSGDLSQFPDGGMVSDWAADHIKTLVALNIVGGSNGMLNPRENIDRAAIAKLLVEVYPLDKALLLPRLDLMTQGGVSLPVE